MTPAEWFALRGDWLSELTVVRTPNGHDVWVRIDGSYADRRDAERVADLHRREITDLVARSRERGAA